MNDDFTPDERRALDAWDAPAPPADFAARVMARARPRRPLWRTLAIAACVVAALGVALWARQPKPLAGEVVATTRTTVDVGGRATAVCEPGTHLRWSVASDGTAEVHEETGDVFYRVEPGGSFAVHTPAGDVDVTGTCFRVEVEMKSGRAMAAGAAVGSILTAGLLVTVYEGSVKARVGEEEATLSAGESRRFEPSGARTPVAASPAEEPKVVVPAPAPVAPEPADAPATAVEAQATAAQARRLAAEVASAKQEAAALQAEVSRLKAALAKQDKDEEKERTYDLSPETLAGMAERCELRWDAPSIVVQDPATPSAKDKEQLELTEEQQRAVDAEFIASNARLLGELRRIYTEATGDEDPANLATDAMVAEIQDKTAKAELKAVFKRLSAERAGLLSPPEDPTAAAPAEQLYRLLTRSGDALEASLAARIGKEAAHALRTLHGGWGGKHRSSYGCPGE